MAQYRLVQMDRRAIDAGKAQLKSFADAVLAGTIVEDSYGGVLYNILSEMGAYEREPVELECSKATE